MVVYACLPSTTFGFITVIGTWNVLDETKKKQRGQGEKKEKNRGRGGQENMPKRTDKH
jgi:hypothetical protein